MEKINKTDLLIAQAGLCFYCGLPMGSYGDSDTSCTQDHLYPKIRGGQRHNNLVLAHGKCNHEKADRLPTHLEVVRCNYLYEQIRNTKKAVVNLRKLWGKGKMRKKRIKYDKQEVRRKRLSNTNNMW